MGAPLRGSEKVLVEAIRAADAGALARTGAVPPQPAELPLAGTPHLRTRTLERLARGAPLAEILELLTREIEAGDADMLASIMLLDDAGKHLMVAAAPSLPGEYCATIHGIAIGPQVGSCGTAAYWGERVIVTDIQNDPRWAPYRELVAPFGLLACWSEPITAGNGQVLGTLAMYYRTVRAPVADELATIADAANIASIAIEQRRTEQRLQRLTRLHKAHGEIGRIIARGPSEPDLLTAVCRVAVEHGGMQLAWIGTVDPAAARLRAAARFGEPSEFPAGSASCCQADLAEGQSLAGRAFRGGDDLAINNIQSGSGSDCERCAAQTYGLNAVGAFPIRRNAQVFGVLIVYSLQTDAFDGEAMSLLHEICASVGVALDALDAQRERAAAESALRRSEQHFRAFFDRSILGLAATDLDCRWIEVNDTLCAMLGYTRDEMLARTCIDLTHPDDRDLCVASWRRLCEGALQEFEGEKRFVHKSGRDVQVHIVARAMRKPDGAIDYLVLTVKDVTERAQTALALRDKNEFLNSILESEPDCVKVISRAGELVQMNHAGLTMLGVSTIDEARAAGLLSFVQPKFRRPFLEMQQRALEGESGLLEFQIRGADGVMRWLETRSRPLHDAGGAINAVLGITRDISERKRSAEIIWKQTNFDVLTGLPNRYMFQDRLAQEIKKARRLGTILALMLIDIDRFKEINDTLGHEAGDSLLVEVSQRIASCVRETDTVARIGGDEFAVILPVTTQHGAAETAQAIIARISEAHQVRNERIVPSASVGVTYFPNDAKLVDGLLKNADQAMYAAKRQGRNRVGFFTSALQIEAQKRMRLVNDLRSACAEGQLQVWFQPMKDLGTNRIRGAEALVRWLHPTRGLVSPAEFIPVAEETGLIDEIGDWVFREAARWALRWTRSVSPDFRVSVNCSPVQFRNASNIDGWTSFLATLGLPGRNMTIEITEGLLLDADRTTTAALEKLHAHGIAVAIDDFGTGYSSLSYLHKFRIDTLKIDQSFVRNLQGQPRVKALAESIIVMAHKLGLTVVAEGVEESAQAAFLAAAGCDFAQGYLYSRPLPPEEFERYLEGPAQAGDEAADTDW